MLAETGSRGDGAAKSRGYAWKTPRAGQRVTRKERGEAQSAVPDAVRLQIQSTCEADNPSWPPSADCRGLQRDPDHERLFQPTSGQHCHLVQEGGRNPRCSGAQ